MSKKLSKYIAAFDYLENNLIFLSATCAGLSISSFSTDIGTPVGIIIASFSLVFSITTGVIKNYLR